MNTKPQTLCALIVLFLAISPAMSQTRLAQREGVVLLRNGGVFAGQISYDGDRYVIDLPGNTQVRVVSADVQFVCRSMDEAYARKLAQVTPGNLEQTLELADWCLRQNMLERSEEQLVDALVIDRHNQRVLRFEQRLLAAKQTADSAARRVAAKPQSLAQASARPAETNYAVQPASAEVANAEVEQPQKPLAPLAIERFTAVVQPVLLNRCSTSACHGSTSPSGFKLSRAASGRPITPQFTHKNLQAVLRLVDMGEPDKSKLLVIPSGPHGGMKVPAFSHVDRRAYNLLEAWVKYVAQGESADNHPAGAPTLVQPAVQFAPSGDSMPTPAAMMIKEQRSAPHLNPGHIPSPATAQSAFSAVKSNSSATKQPVPGGNSQAQQPERSDIKRGNPTPGFQPKDAFDPEIFNRQYHPSENQPKRVQKPVAPESSRD